MIVNFKANFDNTGTATINVNSLGAKTIKKLVTSNLDANDIINDQMVSVIYDGTNFQLLNAPSTLISNNPNSISHGIQNITSVGSTIFTIPPGIHQIYVTLKGAGGGGGGFIQGDCCGGLTGRGGHGCSIYASINCNPGQKLEIFIGSGGINGMDYYESTNCFGQIYSPFWGTPGTNSLIKDLTTDQVFLTSKAGTGGSGYLDEDMCNSYGFLGTDGNSILVSGAGCFSISQTNGGANNGGIAHVTAPGNGSATIEW